MVRVGKRRLRAANSPFTDMNKLGMKSLLHLLPVQIIGGFILQTNIYALASLLYRRSIFVNTKM